jgi:hypothetical protein
MVGDPKPLDREKMARERAAADVQKRADIEKQLAIAETAGDEGLIKEWRRKLAEIEKLERR